MFKFISNEVKNPDNFVHIFECDNDNELATAIAMFMKVNGYTLIEGDVMNAVYEKGNRTSRILLGAFVKYFKFKVHVQNGRVHIGTASSGFSGGLIGISQVKKETSRIEEGIRGL